MADGSDDAEQIDELCKLVERGVVVAAASRYMSGGQQIGGPVLKSQLSRLAGLSLFWLAARRDARRDQLVQGVFGRVRARRRHRLRHRLRDRHRAGREGAPASHAGRGDPDDLARTGPRHVQLQGGEVDPALPQVVPVRVRSQAAARRSPRGRKGTVHDPARRAEGPRQRIVGIHRRLPGRGSPRPRLHRRRHRQPLQVRPGREVVRRPPALHAGRGRLPRRRPHDEAPDGLRPLHRRRRADRWHLVLPHVRLRPPRHQRADHGVVVRRRHRRAPRRPACRRSRT